MPGRTTGNKRAKEALRRERQAEKIVKRDERRVRRNAEPAADGDVTGALVGGELDAATAPPEAAAPAPADPGAPAGGTE